jgi:hypothetical protein
MDVCQFFQAVSRLTNTAALDKLFSENLGFPLSIPVYRRSSVFFVFKTTITTRTNGRSVGTSKQCSGISERREVEGKVLSLRFILCLPSVVYLTTLAITHII